MSTTNYYYGTDLPDNIDQEQFCKILEKVMNWTTKSLGLTHLVQAQIEPTEREGVCKSFRLHLKVEN